MGLQEKNFYKNNKPEKSLDKRSKEKGSRKAHYHQKKKKITRGRGSREKTGSITHIFMAFLFKSSVPYHQVKVNTLPLNIFTSSA